MLRAPKFQGRIVSLRGTHGSGKSTVVTSIMKRYGAEPVPQPGRRKPLGYWVKLPSGELFVVGPYETACGGCDAIQPYADIWPRIQSAADAGKAVLFEGALVSSSYGSIGRSLEPYGERVTYAFLDTPLEVCLERIRQRRAARGNLEPLNPHNTEFKLRSVARSRVTIESLGQRCVTLRYQRAVPDVLALLGVAVRK